MVVYPLPRWLGSCMQAVEAVMVLVVLDLQVLLGEGLQHNQD
jgi:hypothetical protein